MSDWGRDGRAFDRALLREVDPMPRPTPTPPTAEIRCDSCREFTRVIKHVSTPCEGCRLRGETTFLWVS